MKPSLNGAPNRTPRGTFAKGNRYGKGAPLAGRANKLRSYILRRLKRGNMEKIADKLIEMAEAGDLAAGRELLDRTIGKSVSFDILETVEDLARRLDEHERTGRNGHNGRN